MAVTKNIVLNGISQMGNRVVRILEQLVLVPFFLTIWGADYYGEWLTISIIPSVLALSDLGFGTAVSNYFVLTYSNGNRQESSNIYITGLIVISISILLGLVFSALLILFVNAGGILEKSIITPSHIIISLMFLMASRLSAFYSQLFEGFYRAKHKAAIAFNLYTLDGVLRITVGIVTLLLGCDIVGYSIGQFIESIVFNVLYAIFATRIVKDLPSGCFEKGIAIKTLKKGLGFMLTPMYQSLYMQGSTFVVRILLGPIAVAVFNTVRTVCKSLHAIFATVNGSIFPEIQIAYGKGDFTLVNRIYIVSMQLVFFTSIIGVIFLAIFGPTLYAWWTHNELQVSFNVWLILMIGVPFNALWWTSGTVFRALNKPTRFSIYGFVSAISSMLMTIVLAYYFDLEGAALGFITMDVIMLLLTLPLANKEIGIGVRELFIFNNFGNVLVDIFGKRKHTV